jgi:multidrug efflux pump subunit AcrA (membrane-fusion protein)
MNITTSARAASAIHEAAPAQGPGDLVREQKKRPLNWLKTACALVIVAAAAVWAYNATMSRPAMDMNMRITSGSTPFPVTLEAVERGPVASSVAYTGSVAPFNEEDIYPRVTGRIVEMLVYPGDAVSEGQVVARLDDVELSSRVREANAMLATARANQSQMEAELVAAQHGVTQMEKELAVAETEAAYLRSVGDRTERLYHAGAVSRQESDSDRSMAAAGEAKREAARAKLEQARAMETSARKKLDAAGSAIAQGEAAAGTAQIVRGYVEIRAPSSAYVVKRLVAPGVLVQPGMAILKTVQIGKVRLQANVGEKDVALIRVGSPVTVTTSGGQPSISARVTSVFPFLDQGSRTAVVEAIVDNPGRRLLPGQYVTMQFLTGQSADALTVPRGAVVSLGSKSTVWVVNEDRAEPREVTTGLEQADRVQVLSGLEAVKDMPSPTPAPEPVKPQEGGHGHAGH